MIFFKFILKFVQSLGVESVVEVVRRGRLSWFEHVDRKSGNDWVSACRNVVVAGVRCAGRGRKTQERHFNFWCSWGPNFFFLIFQCHRTIEKLEKAALYM